MLHRYQFDAGHVQLRRRFRDDAPLETHPRSLRSPLLKLRNHAHITRQPDLPDGDDGSTDPGASAARSERKAADGLGTSRNPSGRISNTPISLVDPKRFLVARTMRYA